MRVPRVLLLAAFIVVVFFPTDGLRSASLTFVSDVISTSAPSATSTTHTIQFTTPSAIPASGRIVITFEGGEFTIPGAFDYTDVDLAVSTSGAFVDRSLAAAASNVDDGVSVNSGTDVVTITLNSSTGIPSGSILEIELGPNAGFGGGGDQVIQNPSTSGSYRIALETRDSGNVLIDSGKAMIAVIEPVGVTAFVLSQAPVRSNGLPSGLIEAGHPNIEISLNTDKSATCRYATTTAITYGSMTGTFSSGNSSSTIFHATITGHQNDTTYSYFVRCRSEQGDENSDDYEITFTLKPTPISQTSETLPSLGPGGVGDFPNGSSVLYLSSVTFSGFAPASSNVHATRDGVHAAQVQSGLNGAFTLPVTNLERGTYTFLVYSESSIGRTGSFSSTLTLGQGTNNAVSSILLSPSIQLSAKEIGVGDEVTASGESTPGSQVELFVLRSGTSLASAQRFSASTTETGANAGKWQIAVSGLSRGTYQLKVQAAKSGVTSNFSPAQVLGVGEEPTQDFSTRSDMNGDNKINLTDFSILLSFWGTDNAEADINADGIVNLADVSILLFNWTG